jgi:hypothetical protein
VHRRGRVGAAGDDRLQVGGVLVSAAEEPAGQVRLSVAVDGQGPAAGAGEPADTLAAVTVLPTPPLWLAMARMTVTSSLPRPTGRVGDRGPLGAGGPGQAASVGTLPRRVASTLRGRAPGRCVEYA